MKLRSIRILLLSVVISAGLSACAEPASRTSAKPADADKSDVAVNVQNDANKADDTAVQNPPAIEDPQNKVPAAEEEDFCPENPNKTAPGICGCDVDDTPENTELTSLGYPKCLVKEAATGELQYDIMVLAPDEYMVTEMGDSQTFGIALSAKPTAAVHIPIMSGDASEGKVSVQEVIFAPENWNDLQLITVAGVDDKEVDGDQRFGVKLGPSKSDDKNFNGLSTPNMFFECLDDEVPEPGVVLNTNALSVHEGGSTEELTLRLAMAPVDGTVTVSFNSGDAQEVRAYPKDLTFTAENWKIPQTVTLKGYLDNEDDDNQTVSLAISSTSTESKCDKSCYKDRKFEPITITVIDIDEPKPVEPQDVKIRFLAANLTSGEDQSYDEGEGIRLMKAMKPDIVLIQEFNYYKNTIESFVKSTFGEDFVYYRGKGNLPNGIISRYPIVEAGGWTSNKVSDRKWDWAVIDIPGDSDLLAVSVHLYTAANEEEMTPLRQKIEQKIAKDKKNYYIMLGGDFNQPSWNPIREHLSSMFVVGSSYNHWPMDQNGRVKTNASRYKQLDYLLCSPDLCALETPVVIGDRSYPKGHVLDSRVYSKLGELADIPPVKANDSGAHKMQHMAVIRDFVYTVK